MKFTEMTWQKVWSSKAAKVSEMLGSPFFGEENSGFLLVFCLVYSPDMQDGISEASPNFWNNFRAKALAPLRPQKMRRMAWALSNDIF